MVVALNGDLCRAQRYFGGRALYAVVDCGELAIMTWFLGK